MEENNPLTFRILIAYEEALKGTSERRNGFDRTIYLEDISNWVKNKLLYECIASSSLDKTINMNTFIWAIDHHCVVRHDEEIQCWKWGQPKTGGNSIFLVSGKKR